MEWENRNEASKIMRIRTGEMIRKRRKMDGRRKISVK